MMKGQDILDLVISNGINLELHSEIRDQDYIIKMCQSEKDSYLKYKRKNFMNTKARNEKEVYDRIQMKILFKQQQLMN